MISYILEDIRKNITDFYPGSGAVRNITVKNISKENSAIVYRIKANCDKGKRLLFFKSHGDSANISDRNYNRYLDANYEFSMLSKMNYYFSNIQEYSIVKPFKFYEKYNGYLMEGINFPSLELKIKTYGNIFSEIIFAKKLRSMCFTTGKFLATFHRKSKNLKELDLEFIKKQISNGTIRKKENLDNYFHQMYPGFIDAEFRKNIKDMISKNAEELNLACIHNKFRPEHVFVKKDELILTDFQCFDYGSIYEDISRFIVSLDRLSINRMISSSLMMKLKKEFKLGYGDLNHTLLRIFILKRYLRYYQLSKNSNNSEKLLNWHRNKIIETITTLS